MINLQRTLPGHLSATLVKLNSLKPDQIHQTTRNLQHLLPGVRQARRHRGTWKVILATLAEDGHVTSLKRLRRLLAKELAQPPNAGHPRWGEARTHHARSDRPINVAKTPEMHGEECSSFDIKTSAPTLVTPGVAQ